MISRSPKASVMDCNSGGALITDLTISFCYPINPTADCALDPLQWHRIEKELYLRTAQQSAWLHLAWREIKYLTADDLVVTNVRVGELNPNSTSNESWESRPGGIWGTLLLLFS